jgi:hypothetical protein
VLTLLLYMHLCTNNMMSNNIFVSYISYFKLNYLHIVFFIANIYVYNGLISYIFSRTKELMIYFVGMFSFISSQVSILINLLVSRKHVLLDPVISRWILSITKHVYQLLCILPQSVNFTLVSDCFFERKHIHESWWNIS